MPLCESRGREPSWAEDSGEPSMDRIGSAGVNGLGDVAAAGSFPPSAITWTYTPASSRWRIRASRPDRSDGCRPVGTPRPSTPRAVQALLPGPTPTSTPDRTGAHEVKTGLVGGTSAHHHRQVEAPDELLEVEGLHRLRHVLGRDDGPLDDEQVELARQDGRGHLGGALGSDRRTRHHPGRLHLTDALGDELGLDGFEVHLLHARRRLVVRQRGDLVEEGFEALRSGSTTPRG